MIGRFLQTCAYSLGFGFFGLLIAWWVSLHFAQAGHDSIEDQMRQLERESFHTGWLIAGAAGGVMLGLIAARFDRSSSELPADSES